ncbi:unnamed protein product [Closterium sp. NIES-65]|nr:unnamed protein product [Closterium sp. NIES-65]
MPPPGDFSSVVAPLCLKVVWVDHIQSKSQRSSRHTPIAPPLEALHLLLAHQQDASNNHAARRNQSKDNLEAIKVDCKLEAAAIHVETDEVAGVESGSKGKGEPGDKGGQAMGERGDGAECEGSVGVRGQGVWRESVEERCVWELVEHARVERRVVVGSVLEGAFGAVHAGQYFKAYHVSVTFKGLLLDLSGSACGSREKSGEAGGGGECAGGSSGCYVCLLVSIDLLLLPPSHPLPPLPSCSTSVYALLSPYHTNCLGPHRPLPPPSPDHAHTSLPSLLPSPTPFRQILCLCPPLRPLTTLIAWDLIGPSCPATRLCLLWALWPLQSSLARMVREADPFVARLAVELLQVQPHLHVLLSLGAHCFLPYELIRPVQAQLGARCNVLGGTSLLARDYLAAGLCSIQLFLYSPDLRTTPTHLQQAQLLFEKGMEARQNAAADMAALIGPLAAAGKRLAVSASSSSSSVAAAAAGGGAACASGNGAGASAGGAGISRAGTTPSSTSTSTSRTAASTATSLVLIGKQRAATAKISNEDLLSLQQLTEMQVEVVRAVGACSGKDSSGMPFVGAARKAPWSVALFGAPSYDKTNK